MKNASLLFLCCILFAITLPFSVKFFKFYTKNEATENAYMIKVFNHETSTTAPMPLEEYVWRVVAKEMPLSYHDEALKAQIVAARTYALRKTTANAHENNSDVCTDYTHCTAFLTQNEENVQRKADYDRLITLTNNSKEQILTYENQPILAVFHAISSGITEKSSDIWQSQLPYLINVDSSVDEKVNGFYTEKSFTEKELKNIFNIERTPEFEIVLKTSAGSVKTIKVCEKLYSGAEIRKLLNLRSNNFTIKKKDDTYTFSVKGYGHGVGMSQAGANELAKEGMNYKEILQKYYPGTEINNFRKTLNPTK